MNYIGPNKKIGIGWGKSIYAFINEFSDENLTFLQPSWIPMIGGLGEAEQYFQVNELIRELQRKLGGISHSFMLQHWLNRRKSRKPFSRIVGFNQ